LRNLLENVVNFATFVVVVVGSAVSLVAVVGLIVVVSAVVGLVAVVLVDDSSPGWRLINPQSTSVKSRQLTTERNPF
jgi:hypothetical protein